MISAGSRALFADQKAFDEGYKNGPWIILAATIIGVTIYGIYHLIQYIMRR